MLEIKDGKKILTTPISAEDLADIHIGDIIYLNGSMTTCRDVAHRRLVEGGRELPVNVKDAAIFHAGPIIRPLADDKFEMVSVGPTTSMRMEKFEKEFVEQTGVKVIIGKGGMGPNTEYACKNYKAIHCVFPAGNAVVAAAEVEEIVDAQPAFGFIHPTTTRLIRACTIAPEHIWHGSSVTYMVQSSKRQSSIFLLALRIACSSA